jgi:hypothetical protein
MSSLTAPAAALETAAHAAGLTLTPAEPGKDFSGNPTARIIVALTADPSKTQTLELSEVFASDPVADPRNSGVLHTFFEEAAQRLRNPRPDVYLTMLGLPLSFGKFAWPFHGSTSGADTFIVHGEIRLETGGESVLHAKVSASLTRTFAEVVAALEQPFAEGFIYNAVRKTLDQGQLELVKSGNRQPVPVTTRYYSTKQSRFIFNDTDEAKREHFLASKVYWLSSVMGANAPVWIADPRDAQYLNTTPAELKWAAEALAKEGLISLVENNDWATATDKLTAQAAKFEAEVTDALAFIKPTFNEDMRAGHTNM